MKPYINISFQKLFAISTHPYTSPKKGTSKSLFEKSLSAYRRRNLGGLIYGLIALILFFFLPSFTNAQETFEQTITKSAQFTKPSDAENKFHVLNINGSVAVEAYNGDTVKLTITEHIEGSDAEIEQAKEGLTFKLTKRENTVFAYLYAPFIDVDFDDGEVEYDFVDMDDRDYEFSYDIHALVPRDILVEASTMNNGDVTIKGSFRKVVAHNLNGDIKLKHITSRVLATTLNGDVTIGFEQTPPGDSKFKTLNGNIDVIVPENLSADIYFESLQGDFYTNFENFERLNQNMNSNNGLVKYVIGSFTPIRIGDGDIELRFEVLNGDVYLRKE